MGERPLNATAASLLGLLHQGPMTGWDLVGVAQSRIGNFWTFTQSQIYRELTTMAAAGLVRVGEPGPRDRKPYSITRAGRAAFREWVDREPGLEQIRIPLLLAITFGDHLPPGRLAEMVAAQRAAHVERLAGYERDRAELTTPANPSSDDRFRLATLELGLRYERAMLDWFDQLPKILDDDT